MNGIEKLVGDLIDGIEINVDLDGSHVSPDRILPPEIMWPELKLCSKNLEFALKANGIDPNSSKTFLGRISVKEF